MVLSRIIFGYRISLMLGIVVLLIAVPLGVGLGLVAGYFGGTWELVIMRITDIFLAVPSLVLAMAILGLFEPSLVACHGCRRGGLVALVHAAHLQPGPFDQDGRLCGRRS